MAQLDILYDAGARNFLIVNVPPMERTPLFVAQGKAVQNMVEVASLDFDAQLGDNFEKWTAARNTTAVARKNGYLGQAKIFDVHSLFTVLLDNAKVLGYYDTENFCLAYAYGTATRNTQLPGCLPTSAYFWLNTLHPLWTVHE